MICPSHETRISYVERHTNGYPRARAEAMRRLTGGREIEGGRGGRGRKGRLLGGRRGGEEGRRRVQVDTRASAASPPFSYSYLCRACSRSFPPISCPSLALLPVLLPRYLPVKSNRITHVSDQAFAGLSSLTYAPALVLQWRWCGVLRRLVVSLAGDAMCRLHATAHAASYAIPTSTEPTSTSHPAPPSLSCQVSLPHAAFALYLLRRRASRR